MFRESYIALIAVSAAYEQASSSQVRMRPVR